MARQVNEALPTIIDDNTLIVAPHGWRDCRYCNDHRDTRIGLTTIAHIPRCSSSRA